ncbi:MAG: cation-transporting P-type ATPase [Caldilineaceae bacterium]
MEDTYWSQPAEQLTAASPQRADRFEHDRRAQAPAGPNRRNAPGRAAFSWLGLFLRQFTSPILLILIFATVTSFVLRNGWMRPSCC